MLWVLRPSFDLILIRNYLICSFCLVYLLGFMLHCMVVWLGAFICSKSFGVMNEVFINIKIASIVIEQVIYSVVLCLLSFTRLSSLFYLLTI